MKYINQIEHEGLLWVDVCRQTKKELKEIQHRFGLLEADVEESLPPYQRPKIVKRNHYYFVVLHFPIFDRETRRLGFTEVDFFLSPNFFITIHNNKLFPLNEFFAECKKEVSSQKEFFHGTASHILFELLSRLLDSIFPILLHINEDINLVDRKLFSKIPAREIATEILRLKTNIVTFRRTMQGHRTVLERLVLYSGRELGISTHQSYLNSIREFIGEIWNMLESQKESINALHETNESMLSLRTNETMKTLTVISVITFPLTLVATLFTVRAPGTPFINTPFGFWIISGFIILAAVGMYYLFKHRRIL